MKIATKAHKGQTRWGGAPYITHPLRVSKLAGHIAANMSNAGRLARSDVTICEIVGVAHDIEEDTSVTAKDLSEQGVTQGQLFILKKLNKHNFDSYRDMICAIRFHKLASIVKYADITDNMYDLEGKKTMKDKYSLALLLLDERWNIKEYL